MRLSRSLPLALAAAALAGAGVGALSASAAQTHTVAASDSLTFKPATTTVTVGDTVHWSGSSIHTATAVANQSESWDSGDLTGAGFDHTFNTPGTFLYYCRHHGDSDGKSGMVGKVVVQQQGTEALPEVSFKARSLRASRRGVVKLRVRNPNKFPISGTVRLATRRKLGSARLQIDVGQTKTVRVRLSKAARRTLKRRRKLKISVTFVVGTAGLPTKPTKKTGVTLKAPK
jgi:plastocyanin